MHFNKSIGVPEEMIAGLRESPAWPGLEALAHTLVYDCIVSDTMPADRLPMITTPTLVVNSAGTDATLDNWGRGIASALPNASHRSLPGGWHGVPAEDLLPVLKEFFLGP